MAEDQPGSCMRNRKAYTFHRFDWTDLWTPRIPAECQCNEMAGINLRKQFEGVTMDKQAKLDLRGGLQFIRKLVLNKFGRLPTLSYAEVVSCYKGSKRGRYQNAMNRLLEEGLSLKDGYITGFIKDDKFNPNGKKFIPRLIQFRNPKYNLELLTALKPIEQALYTVKSPVTGLRWYAKGLNSVKRGALLQKKFNWFKRPICVSVDMSKFDAHVGVEQLRLEHNFYCSLTSGNIRKLLRQQLYNVGKTISGIRYTIKGQRMSGDANTALGNCVLMTGMLVAAMKSFKIKSYDFMDDGDDCLLFMELCDWLRIKDLFVTHMERFGHKLKVENLAERMNDVEFCQTRPVVVNGVWKMVGNYRKILSQSFTSQRHYNNPKGGLRIAKTLALCQAILYEGVPILGPYFSTISNLLHNVRRSKLPENEDIMFKFDVEGLNIANLSERAQVSKPTLETRVSFEESWGVCIDEQHAMESAFTRIRRQDLDLTKLRYLPEPTLGYVNTL